MSWLFPSGGPSIGASASASVLPMNIWEGISAEDGISMLIRGRSPPSPSQTDTEDSCFLLQLARLQEVCVLLESTLHSAVTENSGRMET